MSRWIVCPQPQPHAKLRLFCFAYAGGSAWVFRQWAEQFPKTVEICAIELPGRGRRLAEPVLTNIKPLIQSLGSELLPYFNIPFACFGHSLGALVVFELCRWLRHKAQLTPCQIWASAARAPHLPVAEPLLHTLPDHDFLKEIQAYNGTPAGVLNNPELMALMLPMLRGDFSVLETYQYQPSAPLDCPIIGFWGQQDTIVSKEDVIAWQRYTSNFSAKAVPGDHFFMHQPSFPQKLLVRLSEIL